MGNHMFIFAWALATSRELNYNLSVPGVACDPGGDTGSLFPRTNGLRHFTREDYNSLKNYLVEVKENSAFTKDSCVDVDFIKQHYPQSNLLGTGYFQNYHSFKKYKDDIKYYFALEPISTYNNTLAVHIRLDDMPQQFRCSLDYYYKCIETSTCEKVLVFTDEPYNSFIEHLKQKYKHLSVDYSHNHTGRNNRDVLSVMSSCKELAISKSTFSWWAAYLGNAEKVYYPSTPLDTDYFADKYYFVSDEDRYIKIS
jgi:hypothetical protein